MPDHNKIYQNKAEQYEKLIASQANLAEIVDSIMPHTGLDIIDLGAGTGRLACVLAGKANTILLLDQSAAMLKVAASKLEKAGYVNWQIQTADHRSIPAADHCADLVVSGWSLGYLASKEIAEWRENLDQAFLEIKRVLRPGGICIIFETMGTGVDVPTIYDFLQGYYEQLEQLYSFSFKTIPLDYHFANFQEAEQLTHFFFGDDIANSVALKYGTHLPEYAGVWWRTF